MVTQHAHHIMTKYKWYSNTITFCQSSLIFKLQLTWQQALWNLVNFVKVNYRDWITETERTFEDSSPVRAVPQTHHVLAAQAPGAQVCRGMLHLPSQVQQLEVHGERKIRAVLPPVLPAGRGRGPGRGHLQRLRPPGQEVQEAAFGHRAALGSCGGCQVRVLIRIICVLFLQCSHEQKVQMRKIHLSLHF